MMTFDLGFGPENPFRIAGTWANGHRMSEGHAVPARLAPVRYNHVVS